jgi:hypothetical protein
MNSDVEGAMGWLWETEETERRRRSGLMLVVLGGLAPVVAVAGVAGAMLLLKAAPAPAEIGATADVDCASALCHPATAAAIVPKAAPAVEETPVSTGSLERRTARPSSKIVKAPAPATPEAAGPPVPPASESAPAGPAPVAKPLVVSQPAAEPRAEVAPPKPPATERAARPAPREAVAREKPVKLARPAKRVAESRRAAEPASVAKRTREATTARPRLREAGDAWARYQPSTPETVALPDGRRIFVRGVASGAFGTSNAYRASQWRITTYRDSIDW